MPLFGKSRGEIKAENTLGYLTEKIESAGEMKARKFRSPKLEMILAHYEDRAYDGLMDWHMAVKSKEYVAIRDRKPFIRMNVPKILASRIASKLIGKEVFPELTVPDDEDTQLYFKAIVSAAKIDSCLMGAIRSEANTGSVFVRFYVANTKIKIKHYCSNYCYPTFDVEEELESVMVLYVYTDEDDLDKKGNPIRKWYKAEFNKTSDILYDNPEYKPDAPNLPEFVVVSQVDHNFGFVQGEWFKTSEEDGSTPDGMSLTDDAITFLDAMNYSLSQSQEATDYNTNPQLALTGMDEAEMEDLISSSTKAWNLGRDGEGEFLESSMNGVSTSMELREKNRLFIQDLTRVILMDPEKMTTAAQSGRSMEILHGPMVDLINELRPQLEMHLLSLIVKIGIANIMVSRRPQTFSPVPVPAGWVPATLDIKASWPPVFAMTIEDLQKHTAWVVNAANNNIISRRTAVVTVAKYFNIKDVDAELNDIENQKSLNPFGMF